MHERIALHDEREWWQTVFSPRAIFAGCYFAERLTQNGQSLRQKTLLGAQPERSLRARRQKTRTVRSRFRALLPTQRTNMLIRRAIAIVAVLRANPVPILRNFSRNPARRRKRRNHVAHQLRLANAPRRSADDHHPPQLVRWNHPWFRRWP